MASETMSKAYGDCKDKSNLMRALLGSIGVESYPVAIYSGDRNFVHEDWASPQQFNHAIIAIKVSEETEGPAVAEFPGLGRLLFFDPTDAYTAPGFLPDHEQASFALVVSTDGGRLVRAPAALPKQNRLDRMVEYTLNDDGSIEGKIHEQAAGSSASENRRLRERLTTPEYRQVIERWVARGVPGASVSTIEAGESDGGGFFLDVNFASERYGRTMGTRLLMFKPAVVSRRSFTHLTDEERENAVVLDADTYSESVTVQLPSSFAIDEMSDPIEVETDFGSYAATWKEEDGKLIFERRMELLNATIEPENYATVKEFFETMIAAEQSPVVLVRR